MSGSGKSTSVEVLCQEIGVTVREWSDDMLDDTGRAHSQFSQPISFGGGSFSGSSFSGSSFGGGGSFGGGSFNSDGGGSRYGVSAARQQV
jgi:hypothetical protein